MSDDRDAAQKASRQRFTVLSLAVVLIAGGLLVLFVFDKIPRAMRIAAGAGDIIAGLFLLVLVRQKFTNKER